MLNFSRLSKYFSGKLPNSEKINISDFVNILEDLGIKGDFNMEFGTRSGALKIDYERLFNKIYEEKGKGDILKILNYFGLPETFIFPLDFNLYESINNLDNKLVKDKRELLEKFKITLEELEKSKNNKDIGNKFEELCEDFLLKSSYFEPGFKEFKFEDGTEKIDRLLKLKKEIGNFGRESSYLGYVILEAKYKKKNNNGADEVSQLKDYIERLHKYGISKYAIVITSKDFKSTYKEKLGDYCKSNILNARNPYYIALITIDEILKFLADEGEYKGMSFDEFIERSFIKWLK